MNRTAFLLDQRSIIVTGAAQGIGRAISELAMQLGARVTAVDMNADALAAFEREAPKDQLLTLAGDVSDPAFAAAAVERAAQRYGAVDGLVNNAGITRTAMIEKMTREAWQKVIDVHLTGSFQFLQAVGRHMLAGARETGKPGGSIVNITSDAGRRGTIGQINYAAAKSGVLGLTMSAAREWGKYGIRVNTIGFGVVETPMTETIRGDKFRDTYLSQIPLGRFGQPGEVAWPVCFLLSDAASYMTGQHLYANGGMTIGM
ncbi:SDR family NAD(P)-dependent oxidoreductase [Achromobacter aegrifaciens]|uniref:SDR family oxidoreductase n=1 Tax=Achromobacter aegrifaciens TaxID=1287736 RepID=A0ABU2DBH9_ACHAE|nr:SDR family oxidoreductase [Achromobacter aegrifaciens]MDR7945428.1 SDR family oxidoreductase [Achromobacter aegrifaciens]